MSCIHGNPGKVKLEVFLLGFRRGTNPTSVHGTWDSSLQHRGQLPLSLCFLPRAGRGDRRRGEGGLQGSSDAGQLVGGNPSLPRPPRPLPLQPLASHPTCSLAFRLEPLGVASQRPSGQGWGGGGRGCLYSGVRPSSLFLRPRAEVSSPARQLSAMLLERARGEKAAPAEPCAFGRNPGKSAPTGVAACWPPPRNAQGCGERRGFCGTPEGDLSPAGPRGDVPPSGESHLFCAPAAPSRKRRKSRRRRRQVCVCVCLS